MKTPRPSARRADERDLRPAAPPAHGADPVRRPHDVGGLPGGPVDRGEHELELWEKRVDALMMLLTNPARPGGPLMTVDELRRGIESLGETAYRDLSYYERWISSITAAMLERGIVTVEELSRKLEPTAPSTAPSSEGAARPAPGGPA